MVSELGKSGFTCLFARGCDLGVWGFAPAPLVRPADHSEPNSDPRNELSLLFAHSRVDSCGEFGVGVVHYEFDGFSYLAVAEKLIFVGPPFVPSLLHEFLDDVVQLVVADAVGCSLSRFRCPAGQSDDEP